MKLGKHQKTESAHRRKGILKDSERQGSRDKTLPPDDGALRRAVESVRTLAQNALKRMRSKAVHPPEKK